jgi:hypothetical protein
VTTQKNFTNTSKFRKDYKKDEMHNSKSRLTTYMDKKGETSLGDDDDNIGTDSEFKS